MSSPSVEQQIRHILGATGGNAALLTDQEVDDALVLYPSDWRLAAAYLADGLASRAISDPSSFTLAGVMSVSWTSQATLWSRTALNLRKQVQEDEARNTTVGAIQARHLTRLADEVVEEFTQPRRPWR